MPKIRGCGSRPDRQVGSCRYAGRSDEGLGRISARSVGQSDGDVRLGTSLPVRSLPTCYRVCVSGKGAKATSTLSGTDACGKLSLNDQAARGDKNGDIERSSSKTGLSATSPVRAGRLTSNLPKSRLSRPCEEGIACAESASMIIRNGNY